LYHDVFTSALKIRASDVAHIVDSAAPGGRHFTTLQAALQALTPGKNAIYVQPGRYDLEGFQPPIWRFPVEIHCANRKTTILRNGGAWRIGEGGSLYLTNCSVEDWDAAIFTKLHADSPSNRVDRIEDVLIYGSTFKGLRNVLSTDRQADDDVVDGVTIVDVRAGDVSSTGSMIMFRFSEGSYIGDINLIGVDCRNIVNTNPPANRAYSLCLNVLSGGKVRSGYGYNIFDSYGENFVAGTLRGCCPRGGFVFGSQGHGTQIIHNTVCKDVNKNKDHGCFRTNNIDSEWSDITAINGGGAGQYAGIIEKGNDEFDFRGKGYLLRAFAAHEASYSSPRNSASGAYLIGSWEVYDSEFRLHGGPWGTRGLFGFCGDPPRWDRTGTFTADGNKIFMGTDGIRGHPPAAIFLEACVSVSITNNEFHMEHETATPVRHIEMRRYDVLNSNNLIKKGAGSTAGQCLDEWRGSWEASTKTRCQ
ncbi:MAG: hypothetical protein ACR2RB_04070, partial [Gammaproteobacteria bacterium]